MGNKTLLPSCVIKRENNIPNIMYCINALKVEEIQRDFLKEGSHQRQHYDGYKDK